MQQSDVIILTKAAGYKCGGGIDILRSKNARMVKRRGSIQKRALDPSAIVDAATVAGSEPKLATKCCRAGCKSQPALVDDLAAKEYPKKAENRGHGRQLKNYGYTQGDQINEN